MQGEGVTMRTRCAAARCRLKFIAAGLLIPVVFSGGAVRAQEVPIGTFKLGAPQSGFSVVEPPAGVPDGQGESSDGGSGRWFFQNLEQGPNGDSPEDMFSDALAALDDGRTADAQRLFERLIADAPSSPHAAKARQHLGRLYSTAAGSKAAAARAEAEAAPSWPNAGRAGSLDVSQPLPRAALRQARVSATLDGQFLSDAGDRVFFSAGNASLGARARGVIQAQARFLKQRPELSAAIEGYADEGSLPEPETLRLSEERAAVVRDRLIAEGIEAARLVAYGRGREDRVSDCPAPECLAQNRRAVTVLLDGPIPTDGKPTRRAQGDPPGGAVVSPTQ
jgi:peptidoglycan-associated lipoprotein